MSNRSVELDVGEVKTSRELHELLRRSLHFPSYYGMNWDAFEDSIRTHLPGKLVFRNWAVLQSRLPRDAATMKGVLDRLGADPLVVFRVEYG